MKVVSWMVLAAAGAVSYGIRFAGVADAQPPELQSLPASLGALHLEEEIQVPVEYFDGAAPDSWIYRLYLGPSGVMARVYVACFERSLHGPSAPHDPRVCYQFAGWRERNLISLHRPSGAVAGISDLERAGQRCTIVYWMRYPGCKATFDRTPPLLERVRTLRGLRPRALRVCVEFDQEMGRVEDLVPALIDDLDAALDRILAKF